MLKTPKFWHKKGFIANLLIPLSVIYFILKRLWLVFESEEKEFKFTSIFVGNPIAGGSGKTPAVIAITKIIKNKYPEKRLCVITKGYGGSIIKPTIISDENTVDETGDEAIIIAKHTEVIVAKNRLEGCKFAEDKGYEIVLFDDGMHDNRIKKNACIMVIDGKYGFGNNLVFPAGPLRDRLDIAAKNATHILLIGRDEKSIISRLKRRKIELPVINSSIATVKNPDKKLDYIAFAGLGRPEKFFDMLKINLGLNISETLDFPDHHQYDNEDLNFIKTVSESKNAKILTTEKDYVKLPPKFQEEVECVKIELKIEDVKIPRIVEKILLRKEEKGIRD